MKILYSSVSCPHPYSYPPWLQFSLAWILTPLSPPLPHSFLIQLEAKVIFFLILRSPTKNPLRSAHHFQRRLPTSAQPGPPHAPPPVPGSWAQRCFRSLLPGPFFSIPVAPRSHWSALLPLYLLSVYSFFKHQFFAKSFLGLSA